MATDLIDLRAAAPSDCEALAAIHSQAWLGAYRGLLDGVELNRLIARRSPAWWHMALQRGVRIKLLQISDEPAGYATYGTCRLRSVRCEGEIYELYLRPEYQGLGFGRRLFDDVQSDLRSLKLKGTAVRVLSNNETAITFYEAAGGTLSAHSIHNSGGTTLKLSIYVWPNTD